MSRPRDPDRHSQPLAGIVEDYTNAFLVVAGVLIFVALVTIWATLGMPAALVIAALATLATR